MERNIHNIHRRHLSLRVNVSISSSKIALVKAHCSDKMENACLGKKEDVESLQEIYNAGT